MKILLLVAAVLIGALLAMQPPVNAEVARRLGSPLGAAMLSLAISLVLLAVVAFAIGGRTGLPGLASLPWWFALGGLAGAIFVSGSILIVPLIGAAAFVACLVLGQAIGASVIDQMGLFNLSQKPMDPWRLLGLTMILAGLIVFQRGGL